MPQVEEVHLTIGAYELIVLASFDSDSDALEFCVSHIEQAPGARSRSSSSARSPVAEADTEV